MNGGTQLAGQARYPPGHAHYGLRRTDQITFEMAVRRVATASSGAASMGIRATADMPDRPDWMRYEHEWARLVKRLRD